MNTRTALFAALLFAATGIAIAQKPIDFADRDFSVRDITVALAGKTAGKTRGLTLGEDPEAPAPAPAPRKVSLQLQFGFNSAELTPESKRRLDVVGEALNSSELASTNLVVSGHTDVSGSYEHNLTLSQRRAEAVKFYLVSYHEVAPVRLRAVGRGPNELLDEEHPRSSVNRRVQLAVAG
jgi:outer membrane protein OmpA-like peptidoglycan-associated protein